jgi:hypothetical protein
MGSTAFVPAYRGLKIGDTTVKSLDSVLVQEMKRGRRQVDRLLRSGGDPAESRRIEHAAFFFLRPAPADGAARQLEDMGYQVRRSTAGLHHVVYFERDNCLTEDSQASFLAEVLVVVRSFAGVYEGWRLATPSSTESQDRVQAAASRSRLP